MPTNPQQAPNALTLGEYPSQSRSVNERFVKAAVVENR